MKKSVITSLSAATIVWGLSVPALAQTCLKTPTCADLGYTKSAADCAGKTILKCPLDNTKVYCEDAVNSNGGETSCPAGYAPYIEVLPYCDESETVRMVQSGSTGCYQCKKCSEGYYFNNNCDSVGAVGDGNGCRRCKRCNYDSTTGSNPIDGRCY